MALEPTPINVEFLKAFVCMLAREPASFTTHELSELERALRRTFALKRPARRLSRLIEFTGPTCPEGTHARLFALVSLDGPEYAWAFDNETDSFLRELRAR